MVRAISLRPKQNMSDRRRAAFRLCKAPTSNIAHTLGSRVRPVSNTHELRLACGAKGVTCMQRAARTTSISCATFAGLCGTDKARKGKRATIATAHATLTSPCLRHAAPLVPTSGTTPNVQSCLVLYARISQALASHCGVCAIHVKSASPYVWG